MQGNQGRSITVEGHSVKEAIEKGLGILGVPRKSVKVHVLSEETKGLFGMRGAKPARVYLTLK